MDRRFLARSSALNASVSFPGVVLLGATWALLRAPNALHIVRKPETWEGA